MQSVKTYLVTGATGAVGSALVPLLLEDAGTQVKLLIRADSPKALTARLESLFEFWGVTPENVDFRRRVQALRGDVIAPRFGLDEATYGALCAECTHIVHSAGNVRMNLPLEQARWSAVGSARNVVAFARACPLLKKVEFVSTVGVGGRLPLVPEDWLTESRIFHNTYEQAKAEAEVFLREQIEQHKLPVTVHRPSMVVGDSQTGKIIHLQIFYYLCEFLSGRQTLGVVPNIKHTKLDTISVDYVAKALFWSSKQTEFAGRIFHLCSGPDQAMEITWLIMALRKIWIARGMQLPRLRLVPLWLFKSVLPLLKCLTAKKTRKALNNLSLFLDYTSDRQRFANNRTNQILSKAGIVVPHPRDYLANLFRYRIDGS